jgi:hypothetical protein
VEASMKVHHVAIVSVLALGLPAATLEARQQRTSRGASPAYVEGYDRGQRAGFEDLRQNERYDFADESDYRRADAGYRREHGSVDWYRSDFRRGYEEGYRTGYQRSNYDRGGTNGGYDQSNPYPQNGRYGQYGGAYGRVGRIDVGVSNGYTDGYDEGFDDGRDQRRNDPFRESRYRSGDHDYRSEYGPRESYKIRYREGFLPGYEDGYREGARGVTR